MQLQCSFFFAICSHSVKLSILLLQIVWENRRKGDIGNDCLVNVDGTDFRIRHAGRRFYSFKYKASGLRYECATSILGGDLVWISGPWEPGTYNDISIFRKSGIMSQLDEGERVEADDGYIGEAPRRVKCPQSMGRTAVEDYDKQQSISRRRHETVNKRFKQFGALKQIWRHRVANHGLAFRVAAITTQLSIQFGEPLFDVDYQDPDWNNDYIAQIEYGPYLTATEESAL